MINCVVYVNTEHIFKLKEKIAMARDREKEDVKNIIKNYKTFEEEIIEQLNYGAFHPTTIGGFREEIWKSLFERIIPKKFKIERSVFIMDSKGKVSNEVDLAIFDEQYTPYIFNYGKIKFIPIEAVAAVIECKSSNYEDKRIEKWIKSINKLETSDESIVRTIGFISFKSSVKTQTSTAPIKIFCHVPSKNEDESEKLKNIGFDIIIEARKEKKLDIDFKYESLYEWYNYINHKNSLDLELDGKEFNEERERKEFIRFKENIEKLKKIYIKKDYKINDTDDTIEDKRKEVPLLSFIFQFNQLLMLLNNPMFFPHQAYVKLFNGETKDKNEEDNEKEEGNV